MDSHDRVQSQIPLSRLLSGGLSNRNSVITGNPNTCNTNNNTNANTMSNNLRNNNLNYSKQRSVTNFSPVLPQSSKINSLLNINGESPINRFNCTTNSHINSGTGFENNEMNLFNGLPLFNLEIPVLANRLDSKNS